MDEWDDQIYNALGDIPDDERLAIRETCLGINRVGCGPIDPVGLICAVRSMESHHQAYLEKKRWGRFYGLLLWWRKLKYRIWRWRFYHFS